MRLLAVDTATEACSVALWLDGIVVDRFEVAGRTHTERLLPVVQELLADAGLKPAQLDGFVCGIGPGSFAGVRIAVGLVKGMALALDRPVVGIGSLAMLAQQAADDGAECIVPCIDARMSEVYWGVYGRSANGLVVALQPDRVAPPVQVEVPELPPGWAAVGTGWGTYETVLAERLGLPGTTSGQALPGAAAALRLAVPHFEAGGVMSADDLAPAYLRDRVALTLQEQQRRRAGE
jgi:tRNA threonylcarbamoyladenosine biosynthesis protein TsaB